MPPFDPTHAVRPRAPFLSGSSGASRPPNLAPEVRGETPRAAALPLAMQQAEAEHAAYLRERTAAERRSMLRGLILIALFVLLASLLRAGLDRAFPQGWWARW